MLIDKTKTASNGAWNLPNRVSRKLGAQLWIVLPVLTVCSIASVLLMAYSLFTDTPRYDMLSIAVFLFFIGPFRIYIGQAGYQIGYDDVRLYQRDWGWNWRTLQWFPIHSMTFNEIVSVRGRFVDRSASKKRFFPFDYVEVRSCNHEVPDIEIYPMYLQHPQDKDVLAAIHACRPELFPQEVLAYMNGG